jgi:hypothetical protein
MTLTGFTFNLESAIAGGEVTSSSYRQALQYAGQVNFRNRKELVTTDTEENAIAAAAIIGLRNPRAASGIAAAL